MTRLPRRMLSALRRERAGREEIERLAREQAAVRRVATLVVKAAAPEEIFAAAGEELARLSRGGHRGGAPVRARWRRERARLLARCRGARHHRRRVMAAGEGVAVPVARTCPPARAARFAGPPGSLYDWLGRAGMRAGRGSPIAGGGRLWGAMIAASARQNALPSGSEHRPTAFTGRAATAIAGVQVQAELAASRARIVAAADETRRRIERDLRDGAQQQQLVSLALRLRAAQAAVPPGPGRPRAKPGRVAAGLAGTLDELRRAARGIHPAILTGGGLAPALSTCYLASRALANAAKHAAASAVHVHAGAAGNVIRLAVRDDGGGGADPARGSSLTGLNDRAEAIGGTSGMRSRPGEDTTLRAGLPARPGQPSAASRPGCRGLHPRQAGGA